MSSSDMEQDEHRLFVACPIQHSSAEALAEWAADTFHDCSVRLVKPEQMHVTLMFYPKVSSETKEKLIELTNKVRWKPVHAVTDKLSAIQRNAMAVELGVADSDLSDLQDRLGRASFFSWKKYLQSMALHKKPLAQLNLSQDQPELERLSRRDRHRQKQQFHITIGRARKGWTSNDETIKVPSIEIVLDRIVLYESNIQPDGVIRSQIASSK